MQSASVPTTVPSSTKQRKQNNIDTNQLYSAKAKLNYNNHADHYSNETESLSSSQTPAEYQLKMHHMKQVRIGNKVPTLNVSNNPSHTNSGSLAIQQALIKNNRSCSP